MAGPIKSQTGDKTIMLLGLGYVARAAVPALKAQGFEIIATGRQEDRLRLACEALNITPVTFDGTVTEGFRAACLRASHLIVSVPPTPDGDPVLNALGANAGGFFQNLEWGGYLSATGVYGERNGQRAYEDEWLRPGTERGRSRIEAELAWLETGLPMHVFRLAGIYGPDKAGLSRHPFDRLKAGTARAVIKPGHIVNRIHADDIVTALMASIARPNPTQIYNVADDCPAPPQNVLRFAANLAGLPAPQEISPNDPSLSAMARSFYKECKVVANDRLKTELGWTPAYPSYKEGLRAVWATLK